MIDPSKWTNEQWESWRRWAKSLGKVGWNPVCPPCPTPDDCYCNNALALQGEMSAGRGGADGRAGKIARGRA